MLPHDHNSPEQDAAGSDSILSAAVRGDEDAVRKVLAFGADVNAVSRDGRNALTLLLTGENWPKLDASNAPTMTDSRLNILRLLASHCDTSLYTLNATLSSLRGVNAVSPLGAAVLLNMPSAVKVLLDSCVGMISVDSPDRHGGTPLMYACRNGNLEVVQHLLAHGARPDFRDVHYRTSVLHALPFPRVLWHCEEVLRRHRAREVLTYHNKRGICLDAQCHANYSADSPTITPTHFSYQDPDFTRTLFDSISSSQSQTIQSLLFPTSATRANNIHSQTNNYLINFRDARGWSPIHYCAWAPRPSIEIIDLLYLAGSDISLSTSSELYTPLHCLALSSSRPRDAIDAALLYSFSVHLVRDLRAPLGSRDRNGETCIHIAAEHGNNIDVLLAFLDCDAKSTVREMRNSRGLTAAEVAKEEFRAAFGLESSRPESAASMRTVRPQKSQKSLRSMSSNTSLASVTTPYDYIPDPPSNYDPSADDGVLPLFEQILRDLRFISKALGYAVTPNDLNTLEDLLVDTLDKGTMLLSRAKVPVDQATDCLQMVQVSVNQVSGLLTAVSKDVESKLEIRIEGQWNHRPRRRTTDSGSSGGTLVSQTSRKTSTSGSTKFGSDPDLSGFSEDESKSRATVGGTEKLKNWLRKKLKPDSRAQKEAKGKRDEWEGSKGLALRSSDRILDIASRDLASIEECMTMADQHIATSYHFISKAETIFSQAIRSRQIAIHNARARLLGTNYLDPTLFTLPLQSPSSSEFTDPDIYDDELLMSFRRFLVRKVEARVGVANGEIEKVNVWLRLVKDVIRGLKERTSV